MSKTELTTTEEGSVPAYLQNVNAGTQTDNFDASDVAIPQIKLLQGSSTEVSEHDNAKPGNFWHTGMDIDLGDSLKFIVCSRRKRYLLQAPLDDGQGILARAEDAKTWDRTGSWKVKIDKKTTATWTIDDLDVMKSGLTKFGTSDPEDENSPPAATLFYEYLVLLPDHLDLGPAVISVARSAIKKAKKGLNDKISLQAQNGRPLQSLTFSAKSVTEQNSSNQDFNNWQFTSAGFAPEEQYNKAVQIASDLADYKVQDEGGVDEPSKIDESDLEI